MLTGLYLFLHTVSTNKIQFTNLSNHKSKELIALWFASTVGRAALLPYVATLNNFAITPSLAIKFACTSAVLMFFAVLLGKYFSQHAGLHIYSPVSFLVPISSGIATGIMIKVFATLLLPGHKNQYIALWKKLLASFYGGITEEVLCRFVILSYILRALQKYTKISIHNCVNCAIIFSALLFSIGHLPQLYAITTPSCSGVVSIVSLNSIGGIVFGALYTQHCLVSAILAHFVADLVVHCT